MKSATITKEKEIKRKVMYLLMSLSIFFICFNAKADDGDNFSYEYEGQTLNYTILSETEKTCEVKEGETISDGIRDEIIPGNQITGKLIIPEKARFNGNEYTVTSIGRFSFSDNLSLTEVTIPESVTSIGRWAFYRCYKMTEVSLSNSVTFIGDNAFCACSSLKQFVIPSSLTTIEDYTFSACMSLTEIIIPNSVTSIRQGAFHNCDALIEVVIGNSVTTIGDSAFGYCFYLTKVTLGSSVSSIGDRVFAGCHDLVWITCLNPEPPSTGENIFWNIQLSDCILNVPEESVGIYRQTSPWSEFGKILPVKLNGAEVEITGYTGEAILTGESLQLKATVIPDELEGVNIIWTSSDERVAKVDATGLVTALEEGEVTITAALADYPEVSGSVELTVISSAGIGEVGVDKADYYNVYSVNGQLILSTRSAEDLSQLAKGLYVINGVKVLIK